MRALPEHIVSFSSSKGKKFFKHALLAGTSENYFRLAEQYVTQQDPAYCGPASLTMVLNSAQIDPNRTWKGIWRWFSEEVLHCTSQEALKKGLSIAEFTQLARCNGLHTMTFQPNEQDPYLQGSLGHDGSVIVHSHTEPLHTTDHCCRSPETRQDWEFL